MAAGDRWRRWVAGKPLEEMVSTLAWAGFSGIQLNRAGYADGGNVLEASLTRILGAGPRWLSRDGVHSCFELAAYAERLRGRYTAAEQAERREEALYPIALAWGRGFSFEERNAETIFRWSAGDSELLLNNPGTLPRRVAR